MALTDKNANELWAEISALKEQISDLQDFKAWAEPFLHRHNREVGRIGETVGIIEQVSATSFHEHNERLEAVERHLEVEPPTCERLDMEPVTPAWGRSRDTRDRFALGDTELITPDHQRRGAVSEDNGEDRAAAGQYASASPPNMELSSKGDRVVVLDDPPAHLMRAADSEKESGEDEVTESPAKRVRRASAVRNRFKLTFSETQTQSPGPCDAERTPSASDRHGYSN